MFYQLYNYINDKYYEELSKESAPMREALIFKHTLEIMPIKITSNDYIAGWYGYDKKPDMFFKEDKIIHYSDIFAKIGLKIEENLLDDFQIKKYFGEEYACMKSLLNNFKIKTYFGTGHTCINYKQIIECGLISYIKKIKNELLKTEENTDKYLYLNAMLISLNAISIFAKRFSKLAYSLQLKAETTNEKNKLIKIANALCKVPMQPADNFFEAVQSIWLLHSLVPISENNWASISLGRLDQYLYQFYKKSIKNGETNDDIKNYLKNLFLLLDSYGDGACALNIGGMDKNGVDQMNELSDILIDVEKEMRLRAPIFVARLNENTPDSIIDKLIDYKLFQIGQPTFYGELPCRKAIQLRGINEEKSIDFSVNSCMGLAIAGEEIADMWGCMFNMHLPLELSVNHGKSLFGELPIKFKTIPLKKIVNIQQILDQYKKYLRELLKIALAFNRKSAINMSINNPNPFLSAITEGCIENGKDRTIGARYNNVTVEAMGMINTANAINVIKTLVFDKQKYTIEDIIKATQNNFENNFEIYRDINKCEKYGTNSIVVDNFCREIGEIFADVCLEFNFENTQYLPSLHTLNANVAYGEELYSTLDGRKKGVPVNKNAGPTNDVRTNSPTNMIISASKINQIRFSGGQPIDVYISKNWLSTKESRDKVKQLILTYFKLGGLQFQVNSIDSQTLETAYDNPQNFQSLIVRVGGYSVRFNDLPSNIKLEFIERFKHEENE